MREGVTRVLAEMCGESAVIGPVLVVVVAMRGKCGTGGKISCMHTWMGLR